MKHRILALILILACLLPSAALAESVFPLLWGISQQFNHLAALIRVGNDARYESFSRKAAAAAPEQPKKSGVKA